MIAFKPFARTAVRPLSLTMILCAALACATPSAKASQALSKPLPDTPVGRLAGSLIQHVSTDKPLEIRKWAQARLSAAIPQEDKDAFVADLESAARDSGGLELIDARINPRQPEQLQVAVKARRDGRHALFVLAADAAQAEQFSEVGLHPMDDPELYADWPTAPLKPPQLKELIRKALDRLVQTEDFSGCVSVQAGGEAAFHECRGAAERTFGTPTSKLTRFHIGSMNKMFTAVAIAQLVEAGKLGWHDSLAQHVPEYPDQASAKKITLWQLLHHSAGLGDFLVPEYFEHSERFLNPADYLDLIARQARVSEPGEQWAYSNAGFMLLGRVIENSSGQSYFDYLQTHIFAPANMRASGFDALDEVVPGLAVGYYRDGLFSRDWKAAWRKLGLKGGPAGGGYSSNEDLLKFAQALRDGRLLKQATLSQMFENSVPAGPGRYAAGFSDRPSQGRHIRGHSGGIEGTTANLQIVWETGAAVAMTSNQGPTQNWMLVERIADLLAATAAAKP